MKREILVSFAGHVLLLAAVAVLGISRFARSRPRPQVFTVRLVNPDTPVRSASDRAAIVEPKPKPSVKAEPKPETQKPPSVVKQRGLGARIEGADALGYAYYLNQILARIADNWVNPYQGQQVTFRATVYFVVEKDGRISQVRLEEGSGNRSYDSSCERALLVTEKLPQLPPEFTGERLKLHLEFEYVP